MDQPSFDLPQVANVRRGRGRPPGARNVRSVDLARYVEAMFGGMTPGQQSAQLALVAPKDMKSAFKRAQDLRIAHPPADPFLCAMVVKATELALALGIDRATAWAFMQKERSDLLPYIHQKQPAAPAAERAGEGGAVFLVPIEGDGGAPIEMIEHFDPDVIEVVPDRSYDDG